MIGQTKVSAKPAGETRTAINRPTHHMPQDAEELDESLKRVLKEPEPEWTSSARSLSVRARTLVRASGFSAFPELFDVLTSGSAAAKFRAAYVLGYTVRNEYQFLESLPTLSEAAQGWVDLATRGVSARLLRQARRVRIPVAEARIPDEAVLGFIHGLATSAAPWAAEGLVKLGWQPGIHVALIRGLENPSLEIRAWCAVVLSHLDKTESSPNKDELTQRSREQVEAGEGAHAAVLRVLIDVLSDARASDLLRLSALRGIRSAAGAVPNDLAAPVAKLRAELGRASRESARYAAIALANLAPSEAQDAVPVLVEGLSQYTGPYDDLSVLGAEALIRIDRRFEAHPQVVEILENQDGPEGYA